MISVIIPIYKAEEYLQDCLLSIQQQSYRDIEVICVNDGSPDNSAMICQTFVDQDSRFVLLNQTNGGVSSARNTGIAYAKGEYICFVDADDRVHVDYLQNLFALYEKGILPICSFSSSNEDLGSGNASKVYSAQEYITHIFDEDIKHPNLWAMLFDSQVIKNNNIDFYVGCIKNEDTEFYIKYMCYMSKVVVSDYKGYFYRINPDSCMNKKIDIKSFTSIEAQIRMADFLKKKGFFQNSNQIIGASVQVYAYLLAKEKNSELYELIHQRYNVKYFMKCMLKHPRLLRKGLSFCYLLLGKKCFYKLLS